MAKLSSPEQKERPEKKPLNTYARYSGLALQMGVIIGLGVFGGVQLDKRFSDGKSTFTIILSLLSVFLAVGFVVKDLVFKKKKKS